MRRRKLNDLYNTGLPFSEILKLNILDCLELIEQKKASLIIIDGKMGEGKTTLAFQIGQLVESHYKKNQVNFYEPLYFDMKKQIGMGGELFKEKLQICNNEKLKVVIYDEAGDFSKRGALSGFNLELNRIFQTFRTFKILIVVCLPCFNVLDNNLFDEGVPKLLLNVYGRNEKEGQFRVYGSHEMLWLKYYMSQEKIDKQKCYKMVVPNFRGQFLDLPKNISEGLDKFSTEGKKEILSNSILKSQDLVSYKDIARALNKSIIWVRKKVSDTEFKPIKKYKNKNYYDKSIIDELRDY